MQSSFYFFIKRDTFFISTSFPSVISHCCSVYRTCPFRISYSVFYIQSTTPLLTQSQLVNAMHIFQTLLVLPALTVLAKPIFERSGMQHPSYLMRSYRLTLHRPFSTHKPSTKRRALRHLEASRASQPLIPPQRPRLRDPVHDTKAILEARHKLRST